MDAFVPTLRPLQDHGSRSFGFLSANFSGLCVYVCYLLEFGLLLSIRPHTDFNRKRTPFLRPFFDTFHRGYWWGKGTRNWQINRHFLDGLDAFLRWEMGRPKTHTRWEMARPKRWGLKEKSV